MLVPNLLVLLQSGAITVELPAAVAAVTAVGVQPPSLQLVTSAAATVLAVNVRMIESF